VIKLGKEAQVPLLVKCKELRALN